MKIYSFEKLEVWILAKELTVFIYEVTRFFPQEEQFGLTNQLRRAIVSVGSNIAEGSGRTSKKDFAHFIQISYASMLEVMQQLIISKELGYIDEEQLKNFRILINQITLKLGALRKSLLVSNLQPLNSKP